MVVVVVSTAMTTLRTLCPLLRVAPCSQDRRGALPCECRSLSSSGAAKVSNSTGNDSDNDSSKNDHDRQPQQEQSQCCAACSVANLASRRGSPAASRSSGSCLGLAVLSATKLRAGVLLIDGLWPRRVHHGCVAQGPRASLSALRLSRVSPSTLKKQNKLV